ncbi:uncharacterized protein LOC108036405 [Drosophila biarmipes]|uniref:uncharacterized protein LOC108036405 n=1 Tax=Drosophila biarmipes TaxID=125945 RepID=UPI001CDAD8B1|nr:uncharacterized protein LOC108036405 [Drosophila biarmipes]
MQSFTPLLSIRMDVLLKTFLLVSLLSMICSSASERHGLPPCTRAGRCYTVNRPFGHFRQTRCVPCSMHG